MTLIYVLLGCSVQFLIGLGLAYLCSLPIAGRAFFRVVFFVPLMITPVGIAYQWRMLADMRLGPVTPLWHWAGLGEFAWGSNALAARLMVMVADGWMWIPFMFVVMLAALETVSRDQVEAAEVDGAGKWFIFRDRC
jgi:multiple sugar transport system permease protein